MIVVFVLLLGVAMGALYILLFQSPNPSNHEKR